MDTALYAYTHNPELYTLLQDQFRDLMTQTFRGRKRGLLCAYLGEGEKGTKLNSETWEKIYDIACATCWRIFLEVPDKVLLALEKAQSALENGYIDTDTFVKPVCSAVVQLLSTEVFDSQRDRYYALLRQAIDRKTVNGKPRFQTQHAQTKGGMYYAPRCFLA